METPWPTRRPKERGSWKWHGYELLLAGSALPRGQSPVSDEGVLLWIENLPPDESDAADEAARYYAQAKRWPPLSDAVRAALHLRLSYARGLCENRRRARAKAPEETWGEIFAWLLIDCWHARNAG